MSYRPRPKQTRNVKKELGYKHQQHRARMLAKLVDGTACWWCNEPMYRDPAANWDGRPLAADHDIARVNGGIKASRLLHFGCNSARGDGSHDHRRPALTGKPFTRGNDDGHHDPDERSAWCLLDW